MSQHTSETALSGEVAHRVVRRENRRIRLLIALTISLWVLAAAMLPAFYLPLHAKVMPRFREMERMALENDARLDAHMLAGQLGVAADAASIAIAAFLAVSASASLLAAISTLLLVVTVRRVTLRQLSSSLAEISGQLRAMQQGAGGAERA